MTNAHHCESEHERLIVVAESSAPLSQYCCACRHLSAAEGCYSIVSWLVSQGVAVNAVDRFKRTPLEVRHLLVVGYNCGAAQAEQLKQA